MDEELKAEASDHPAAALQRSVHEPGIVAADRPVAASNAGFDGLPGGIGQRKIQSGLWRHPQPVGQLVTVELQLSHPTIHDKVQIDQVVAAVFLERRSNALANAQ